MQRSLNLLCIGTCIGLAGLLGTMFHHHSHVITPSVPVVAKTTVTHSPITAEAYGRLPLSFEQNQGQVDKQVAFLSHGPGYNLFLTANQAVISLHHPESHPTRAGRENIHSKLLAHRSELKGRTGQKRETTSVLRLKLLGANAHAQITGLDELPGSVNYFIGNDPKKWRSHVPTYSRVSYKQVYPGIDMVYYGNQKQLEYDWVVAPQADVHTIQIGIKGAEKAVLTPQGDLLLHTSNGDVIQHAPVAYQEIAGTRKPISSRLVLLASSTSTTERRIGFEVATYNHSRPLVIDPVVVYSTYFGGSGYVDGGTAIAVDSVGNAYVTGFTESVDFPTEVPFQSSNLSSGGMNVYVSEVNASGTALIYSTYLGGSGEDGGSGIAVDSVGNAYVTGSTDSTDFPIKNPYQSINHSSNGDNVFVTKFNSTGSALIYSTYLGGSGQDQGNGIAVDASGNAYVTGSTSSTNFPTLNPYQSTSNGGTAFVTKFNSIGSVLYSTYLGGSALSSTQGNGIAVDASGNAYVTGSTSSTNFPTLNPYQSTNHGVVNAFVTKFNSTGSALIYSTYLGGSGQDQGNGIAVDASGNAYVTGLTISTNFPTKNAFQATNHQFEPYDSNAFVTKLNSSGSALVYSTYLGGSGTVPLAADTYGDAGQSIAIDSSGNAYITGYTSSDDFPTQNTLGFTYSRGTGFITKLNSTGSALVYSSYLYGSPDIAVDPVGNAYIIGGYVCDMPLQNPLQTNHGSNTIIARIGSYNWQTVDVTVGSDNYARLMWINTNFMVGLWSVNNSGQTSNISNIGPFGDYTVQATSAGTDGLTRMLWNENDGTAALWLLNANNTFKTGYNFGPYTGWYATDVTVGSDNKTRMLWTKSDGTVGVWTVDNAGNLSNLTNIGPFAGWTASRIAAGSDGYTRLLWNKNDGTVAVWLLNANNTFKTGLNFGPYTSWRGIDIAVGSDNKTRLLWTKSDGTAGVWTVDNNGVTSNLTNVGPFAGWTATKIAAGSDGLSRLLWFKGDGTQGLWLLNANNTFNNGFNFGPY